MFPWVLCLLSSSTNNSLIRNAPAPGTNLGVWWSPKASSRKLEEYTIQEGDILAPVGVNSNLRNAIKSKGYLWENGTIPYDFGEEFSSLEKNLIMEAMEVLEAKTCVRFIEKEKEKGFIRFQKEKNGCYAPIGKLSGSEGPLPVNLQSPECFKEVGIIEHELLHVIGLFHEQSRPDRDDYVTIHWCNIEPQRESDFLKGNAKDVTTFDLPYDYNSIMHYPRWAFSKNGKPTITAKDNPDLSLGQREHPTESDFEKVRLMYDCK